jgi:large subunit ribosomal protein L22
MEYKVIQRFVRVSPFKSRKVADLIRGKKAGEALSILKFLPKKSASILEKIIKSAVANAEQSQTAASLEDLIIKRILIDEGPTMKRYMFRAQGRVYKIRKRTSHIVIVLEGKNEAVESKKK